MSVLSTSLLFFSPFLGGFDSVDALAFSPQRLRLPNLFQPAKSKQFRYIHLEGNGQLWQATDGEVKASVLVDPIASQLDFGIPDLYRANKLALSERRTIDLICDARPSHCLLTMGLDDHTHLPTLELLRERLPQLKYVVAPSCEQKLLEFGLDSDALTILDHGEVCALGEGATVTATRGALVGPPWQKRENGYLLTIADDNGSGGEGEGLSIYYEPHSDVVLDDISKLRADIMVAPVTKQSLPAQVPPAGRYTLVYGGECTLEIAERLGAKVVVPLGNGALDIEGPLAGLVSAEGDVGDFERLVERRNVGRPDVVRVERAAPGVPLTVPL